MTQYGNLIQEVLKVWNQNVKSQEINVTYIIEIKHRVKKYYLTKDKSYERTISELLFYVKGDQDLLLYRKELQRPKIKETPSYKVEQDLEDMLYKYFLHEAIGIFGQTCHQLITNQDYAEYDIEKDRLKAHPSFKDHVIEVLEDGAFYKKGDKFDVFNRGETSWIVYTAHDIGLPNGGFAKIDSIKCKVVQETEQKIELLEVQKPQIIL